MALICADFLSAGSRLTRSHKSTAKPGRGYTRSHTDPLWERVQPRRSHTNRDEPPAVPLWERVSRDWHHPVPQACKIVGASPTDLLLASFQYRHMHHEHQIGYKALRKGRQSLPGHVYLVTTVTRRRQRIFGDPEIARCAAAALAQREVWEPGQLLCWVLMPDHWHGLLILGQGQNLSASMARMKASVSRRIGKQFGPIWMPGFHDRILRDDEDLKTAARYLVANPLRAGLVRSVLDYSYWDAIWLEAAGDLVDFGW